MPDIKILDSHTADLIAAGEVVERPASALKELVENAIDAGAHAITAEIKNGGKSLMRVTDDGSGMSGEDASRCLLRHATSKISTPGDLERITTLGFRGEALAAICAVSVVRIITKRREDSGGVAVLCDNGTITEVAEAAGTDGTSIIVTQLFAKMPARQKFLKTDMGEAGACSAVMEKTALSHPEISFRFISDGEEKLHTPGDGDLYNAIYTALGRNYARALTPVSPTGADGIKVTGYVSRPECPRKNRGGQHFFINGRTLRSRTLTAALEEAFGAYIESGTYPACVLNVGINVHLVDVNVHPQKLEVKFSDERAVFNAVYHAVRDTISQIKQKPVLEITEPVIKPEIISPFVPTLEKGEEKNEDYARLIFDSVGVQTVRPPEDELKVASGAAYAVPSTAYVEQTATSIALPPSLSALPSLTDAERIPEEVTRIQPPVIKQDKAEYTIIGEAYNTYIIIQTLDSLLLVDKHAAHERILYEELISGQARDSSQLLLTPVTVELAQDAADALFSHSEELTEAGFEIERFGYNTALVRSLPQSLMDSDIAAMISEMADRLREGAPGVKNAAFGRAMYTAACKAAIKGGRIYGEGHIKWLVDKLMSLENMLYCPHGRPAVMEIPKKRLDYKFGR